MIPSPVAALLSLLPAIPDARQNLLDVAHAVPVEVAGWTRAATEVFSRETVFDYLNGGAELYLTYEFQGVLALRYERPSAPDVLVDLFDMGRSEDAFGIFSLECDGEDAGIGQDSDASPGILRFWKDRFFISITMLGLTADATQTVRALGHATADAITNEGSGPRLLHALPPENLNPRSIRYSYSHSALRQLVRFPWEDVLALEGRAEAILAAYGSQDERTQVLIVLYPDSKKADQGRAALMGLREESMRPAVCLREGPLLVTALDSTTAEAAQALVREIVTRWKEANP